MIPSKVVKDIPPIHIDTKQLNKLTKAAKELNQNIMENQNKNTELLEIEKDRVLKAAEECGNAREIFKVLWPEVFESESEEEESLEDVVVTFNNQRDLLVELYLKNLPSILKEDTGYLIDLTYKIEELIRKGGPEALITERRGGGSRISRY